MASGSQLDLVLCFTKNNPIPWRDALQALLPAGTTVRVWEPGSPKASYAVVWHPSQEFLDHQTDVRTIFSVGAGVDALLAKKRPLQSVIVRLNDAGMAVQMAEYVCHYVIRFFRELSVYEQRATAAEWRQNAPQNRSSFTIAIMGMGVLGQRIARALTGFEYTVRGFSRSPKTVPGVQCFSGALQGPAFSNFLSGANALVCVLPLTQETENIINKQTLGQLAAGSLVINVARGAHVVDDDLLAMLDNGHVAHAVLDVFRTEPLPADHVFWRHRSVTVTPHTSARTLMDESVVQIASKLHALLAGEPITGIVDPDKGY